MFRTLENIVNGVFLIAFIFFVALQHSVALSWMHDGGTDSLQYVQDEAEIDTEGSYL